MSDDRFKQIMKTIDFVIFAICAFGVFGYIAWRVTVCVH